MLKPLLLQLKFSILEVYCFSFYFSLLCHTYLPIESWTHKLLNNKAGKQVHTSCFTTCLTTRVVNRKQCTQVQTSCVTTCVAHDPLLQLVLECLSCICCSNFYWYSIVLHSPTVAKAASNCSPTLIAPSVACLVGLISDHLLVQVHGGLGLDDLVFCEHPMVKH